MSEDLVRTVINNNGLKIKLYVIDCPQHRSCPKMNYFVKNPKYDRDELAENLNDSKFSPYELCMLKSEEIFNELENGLFVVYSCLLIVINMLCLQRSKVLKTVCKCLKANKHLRYKSKIILSMYRSKSDLRNGKNNDSIATAFFIKYVSQLRKQSHFLHPTEIEIKKRQKPSKIYFKMIVKDTLKSLKDSDTFMENEPENTIYLQSFIHREHDIGMEIESVMHQTYNTPLTAMQVVLLNNTEIVNDFRLIQTSSLAEFYFYSINPALAIIINQYYFTNSKLNRTGSDQDVLHLVRELKVARIPFILLEDCNKEQLYEILNYLSKKNFWPLEKFLFFMMSHGDSKGNINTADDDKIHIMNDVIKTIQKNESLKSCTQFLSMVNCRGGMNPDYAEEEDFDAITPTDNSSLHDNSVLLYSVPDQMKSVRSTQHGTALIASLCKHFRTIYHNDSIKTLIDSVNMTLKKTKHYRHSKMTAELVCKDTAPNQSIIPIPIVATDMIRLVQSIVEDNDILFDKMFSSRDGNGVALKTTFHITGNLCKKTIDLNPLAKKYFSQQLNNNSCELVKEFENMSTEKLNQALAREGSVLDVLRLIREHKVAAVPHKLIEDCNKQQLFEILNYLRNKALPFEKLLVFVMVLQQNAEVEGHNGVIMSMSSLYDGFYFSSINPALALILRLIRELKVAAESYKIIEDSNQQQLFEILKYLRNKALPLEKLLIFVMVLLQNAEIERIIREIKSSSSLMNGLHFSTINPALAIIINQYHFTRSRNRKGSDLDVLRLIDELKLAVIPYILIEDCNKQQLFKILNYLRNKDLPLQKLLVFVMSHGDSAGNIYTTDDKVHIMNDIVIPMQQNDSLKSCTKLFCMVNCRGNTDARDADFGDFDNIKCTDNSSLPDSTVVVFSVPDQMKSPRFADDGTPFIESFCKHFRAIRHDDCIKTFINDVNKTLKKARYYKCFPNNSVELVGKDTATNQSIKPIPTTAVYMIRLLQTTAAEIRELLSSGHDNGDNSIVVKPFIFGVEYKKQPVMVEYSLDEVSNDYKFI
ncbi:hypothetical protein DOY81_001315 [Sarcophaga bullata]|nr:hypothetical protein DOY81_001315 [Sarcophaga bullata]